MSIEKKYKKLDDRTHVLQRSGMYLGSIKPHTSDKYLFNFESKKFEKETITYNPAFIKIFDEIITNAVDEHKREGSKLDTIKINISDNRISIWDNGGIPVVKHKEHNEWIPEMIFSNLKAGSNFNDDEQRTTAGLNGVGSVLTNIFSKEFKVSTCDGKNIFEQTFSNNMLDKTKPKIRPHTRKHTEISYFPDYEKFGMVCIDTPNMRMLEKRIIDIAGCNPSIKIYLNDKLIQIKSFENYIQFYTNTYFYESSRNQSWSIGVAPSYEGFQQVSFANSAETYDGGTHVDYILNQILSQLREFFQKKHKVDVRPSELKNHIILFINSTIINPSFGSQTKEKLITEIKDFGYTYEITDKLIKSILKSEIVDSILDWIEQKKLAEENKLARELNKNLSKIKVDKLIDAKGKDRWKCTLGLFEGDCLQENTKIRVIRNSDIIDVDIKDILIDDLVITHTNSISNIYAITKKIKKKAIIKIKDDELICGHKHKWFVYDNEKNEFYFEETQNIKKHKHKLIKNYLAFTESLLKIKESNLYMIKLESGQIFDTNPDHTFAIYNTESNKFEMLKVSDIDKKIHFLVNTFKL